MRPICVGPWGGTAGSTWSFNEDGKVIIKQIVIVNGSVIDSILFKYEHEGQTGYSQKFGGNGGNSTTKVDLDWPREYITSIRGHYNSFWPSGPRGIKSLTILTNVTKYGPFGVEDGAHFSLPMEGAVIVGFHGRKTDFLDAIGVYVKPLQSVFPIIEPCLDHVEDEIVGKTVGTNLVEAVPRGPGPWGGQGGKPWDDGVFSSIKQIYLYRGEKVIHSIQIEYAGKNEQSVWSEKHGSVGGNGNTTNRIKLDYPSEILMKITGFYAPVEENGGLDALKSICFFTNKGKYGPFGDEIGIYFTSYHGKVVGIHGRSGAYLDALGVHMEYF